MKVSAIIAAALASVAAASPRNPPKGCTPGTYACTGDAKGWMVCNTSRQFVVSCLFLLLPSISFSLLLNEENIKKRDLTPFLVRRCLPP